MNNPLVSIIIPLYNAENFIAETIQSVLNQSYKNIEIIIVDDGSTDNSLAIAKEFESENIKIISQRNRGASAARNVGLREAKGEYIQFLDADDLLSPNKIDEQLFFLKDNPDSIASCQYVKFSNNINSTIGPIGPHVLLSRTLDSIEWLLTNHTMLVHAWLCPKHIIEKAGLWNESLSLNDDGEYFTRVVINARKVIFCKQTIVYYRAENPNSISKTNSEAKIRSGFLAAQSIEKELLSISTLKNGNLIKKTIGNNYKKLLYIAYSKYPIQYIKFKDHWSLRYADISYNAGGRLAKSLNAILGWKLTVKIKQFLNSKQWI